MPAFPSTPNTRAIGNAIVGFLTALQYPSTASVYTLAQLEEIKDITPFVQGTNACVEVYCNNDTSQRRGFGGRMWDEQTWFILSICSLDTAAQAAQIYDIRDQLVQPFQAHAQLNNVVSNLFHSQLQDKMRFLRIMRNGVFYRAHLAELMTRQEWTVPIPPGVVS